jgi:hypothetical protein
MWYGPHKFISHMETDKLAWKHKPHGFLFLLPPVFVLQPKPATPLPFASTVAVRHPLTTHTTVVHHANHRPSSTSASTAPPAALDPAPRRKEGKKRKIKKKSMLVLNEKLNVSYELQFEWEIEC